MEVVVTVAGTDVVVVTDGVEPPPPPPPDDGGAEGAVAVVVVVEPETSNAALTKYDASMVTTQSPVPEQRAGPRK